MCVFYIKTHKTHRTATNTSPPGHADHEWVYGVSADQLGVRSFDLQPSRLLIAAQARETGVDTNFNNLRTSVGDSGGVVDGAADGANAPQRPTTPNRSRASTAEDMASFSSDFGDEGGLHEHKLPSRWDAVKSNLQVYTLR